MPTEIIIRDVGGTLNKWKGYIAGLASGPGELKRIHRHATWQFARFVRRKVKVAYLSANYPVSFGTVEAYRRPGRKVQGYRATKPLRRSGTLSRSVILRKYPRGYQVRIHPTKTYSSGVKVTKIAEMLEAGYQYTMPVTKRRLRYLHYLVPEDARKAKVGGTIAVVVTPRPIWEPTYKKMKGWRRVYFAAVNRWMKVKKGRTVPKV